MSQREYAYVIQPLSLTVHTFKGRSFTWSASHPAYDEVKDALRNDASLDEIESLMDVRASVQRVFDGEAYGDVSVEADGVYYRNQRVDNTLTERILAMIDEELPIKPWLLFMDNLYQNPRHGAHVRLYDFLASNDIPFTDDGCFLVYKKVNDEYKDDYTNTFDNSVGATVRVEPFEVEEDPTKTCARGLHVCARHYLGTYTGDNGHIMICKVNPEHVIAVPIDYNNAKMRVYQYEVIGEVPDCEKGDILEGRTVINRGDDIPGAEMHDDWYVNPDSGDVLETEDEDTKCDDPDCPMCGDDDHDDDYASDTHHDSDPQEPSEFPDEPVEDYPSEETRRKLSAEYTRPQDHDEDPLPTSVKGLRALFRKWGASK